MTPITDDVSRLSLLVSFPRNLLLLNSHLHATIIFPSILNCCKKQTNYLGSLQKQNIPSDYEIPVSYIPKEVVSELHRNVCTLWFNLSNQISFIALTCSASSQQAGTCWVVLNIYPLEQSLRKLAGMFGSISSNREHIVVFITMLKSLRFTFDHEELVSVFSRKDLTAPPPLPPTRHCTNDLP